MEASEPMGEPRDGVAFAAARAVLNEIVVSSADGAGVVDETAHGVQLMIAGEDKFPFAGLFAVLVAFLATSQEVVEDFEQAVALPDALPKIGGREAIRIDRVARAFVVAPVEGQEARCPP